MLTHPKDFLNFKDEPAPHSEEPAAASEEIDAKEDQTEELNDESQEEVSELPPTSPQDDSGMS